MPVFERLKYAFYVLNAVTMILMLTLSISEGLGLIRGVAFDDLAFHPLYLLSVLAVGFGLAPLLSKRVPIAGDQPANDSGTKPSFGYTVRAFALVVLGFALAILANLVVFPIGRPI